MARDKETPRQRHAAAEISARFVRRALPPQYDMTPRAVDLLQRAAAERATQVFSEAALVAAADNSDRVLPKHMRLAERTTAR